MEGGVKGYVLVSEDRLKSLKSQKAEVEPPAPSTTVPTNSPGTLLPEAAPPVEEEEGDKVSTNDKEASEEEPCAIADVPVDVPQPAITVEVKGEIPPDSDGVQKG